MSKQSAPTELAGSFRCDSDREMLIIAISLAMIGCVPGTPDEPAAEIIRRMREMPSQGSRDFQRKIEIVADLCLSFGEQKVAQALGAVGRA